ncbi:MgtC/SapB family protein [Lysobacter tyrosinilyticus]
MVGIDELRGLAVALGIGLLVGIERERRARERAERRAAGVRTFALIALAGAIAERLGAVGVAIAGGFVALAALASYRNSRADEPGLTTEVAMLVVFLLGVLAMREVVLAAGLGVAVALLLAAKSRVHRFVSTVLTEQELHDALLLAAAAAIVLPLLPDRVIDPWHVLNPYKLWLLAVIIMTITAAGHVALRAFGARTGLLLAGLAGGFASSTATIASMGARAKKNPELAMACAGAGVVSNVSTVVQLAVISGALSPPLLRAMWPAIVAAGAVIVVFALAVTWASRRVEVHDTQLVGRPFEPKHVLVFIAIVATVMLLSGAMLACLGDAALEWTLAASGIADVHAATATAAQLVAVGRIDAAAAVPGVALAFAANSTMKLVLAFATGGRAYALRVMPGVVGMVVAFWAVVWWF